MDQLGALLPLLLILALFVPIVLRNRSVRRRAVETQSQLAPGSEVMTTAGLYGRVSSVEDDVVVLEVSDGVRLRFARQAVARVLTASNGRAEPGLDPEQ